MGGSKNKSPAQKDKSQKRGKPEQKKEKKSGKVEKNTVSVLINETQAAKYIKESNVITAQDLARHESIKISTANSYLRKSLDQGVIKKVGGFSGHYIYKAVSG